VTVVARVRRLLDLDADPCAIDAHLATDPSLAPLVAKRPGLRSAGAVDGFEMAVRAVVGQQISVSGARTVLGRIVAEHGPIAFDGQDFRLFPAAADFADIDPTTLPMPRARGRTLIALARACASGELTLDPGADRDRERATLLALPGIGPWTADYVRMRTMRDPDVLLATDLGVRKSADRLGIDLTGGRPDWAPWRSYASHHLWAALH
jgi:AraC family transcriptional regulator of adaptative response / DNA-3-methyladenine glycosylase II